MGMGGNVMSLLLYLREKHGTHHKGGWVGPRIGLNAWENLAPHWDSIPGQSNP